MERLIAEMQIRPRGPLDWDVSDVWAGVCVELDHLPSIVARAFAAIGFSNEGPQSEGDLDRLMGKRGCERLLCWLLHRSGQPTLEIELRSLHRPPVQGGAARWHEREWPTFFDAPVLYASMRTNLIVEGGIPVGGMAAVLEAYRTWASKNGFRDHRDVEPDMNEAAGFADREFTVQIQDRDPFVTLSVLLEAEPEIDD